MIGKRYKANKDNVIDLFNGYKNKRGQLNDGNDITFLENRLNTLENGKYTLAVAGEVKAGKSTFINALLGAEILPADVLQATSAIVEIFKSDKSFLKIKYANGQTKEIYDDLTTPEIDEAKEALKDVCSIPDKYRDIPTTIIDQYIAKSDRLIRINNELIEELGNESDSNLKGKKELLKQYVKNRKKEHIPIEIQFGFPLKWDFDELRIVDSPGVNAVGGVQNISFQFFENANAILFVHPIKPIESESFSKFVNKVISNRSKETLFLILTHAGLYSESDVNKLHGEAIRLYEKHIHKDRVIVVDSLLKLIYDDFEIGKTIKEIRKTENKKKILASFREKAEDEERELKDVVKEAARFERMFNVIDEFSMQAPNLQLQEILESIKKGYEEQTVQYDEKSKRLMKKKKNPQEFELEIDRINTALEEYRNLIGRTKKDLKSKYVGIHADWNKDTDKLKIKYPELITLANDFELVRKHFSDGYNGIQDIINYFSTTLTSDLSQQLDNVGKKFQEEHNITVPKPDLKALEEKAKDNAYRDEPIYGKRSVDIWDIFSLGISRLFRDNQEKIGSKSVFNKAEHLKAFKTSCMEAFYELIEGLKSKSKFVLDKYLSTFSEEMNEAIKERQKALEEEKNKQQNNNELIVEIEGIDSKKKLIPPELKRVTEILEDIKC